MEDKGGSDSWEIKVAQTSASRLALRRPLSAPGCAFRLPQAPASLGHSAAWAALAPRPYRSHFPHGEGTSSELGSLASSPEMVKVLPGACESGFSLRSGSGLGLGLGLVASAF